MEQMTWSIQTSSPGITPVIISEYVLNDLGVFVKRERRISKKAPLHAITGFRVGYTAIPGTDYRSAPIDRNAILWYKVTCADEIGQDGMIIRGNRDSEIIVSMLPENRDLVLHYIQMQRSQNPVIASADYTAASWLCWRDDDDWGDTNTPLAVMIENESETERFIEPEVLEETVLPEGSNMQGHSITPSVKDIPAFCKECGTATYPDSCFCEKCGACIT